MPFNITTLHVNHTMNLSRPTDNSCSYTEEEILAEWSPPDVTCDVIMHVLGVVAFALNTLAFTAYRHLPFPQSRFLRNLAVADALLPVVFIVQRWVPPFVVIDRCHVTYGCVYVLDAVVTLYVAAMSLLSLAGLVANHAIAIFKPLRYHGLMTEKKTSLIVAGLWLFPSLCVVSTLVFALVMHTQQEGDDPEPFCETLSSDFVTLVGKIMWVVMAAVVIIIVVGMYIKVYIVAKKSMYWDGRVIARTRELRRNIKALRTTVCLLASLLFSWCLIVACMVAISHDLDEEMYPVAVGLFHIWLVVNSITDPIIVTLRMKQVKVAYRELCRCVLAPSAHHPKSSSLTTSSMRETEMVEFNLSNSSPNRNKKFSISTSSFRETENIAANGQNKAISKSNM